MLVRLVPLVTFGQEQQGTPYAQHTHDVAVIHSYIEGEPDPGTTYDTIYYVEAPSYRLDPCYIGIVPVTDDGTFTMQFNIQIANRMALSALTHVTTRMDIWSGSDPAAPTNGLGSGVVGLFPNVGRAAIEDASYTDAFEPERFTVQTSKELEPDQWHHLLLSFDVGGSVSLGTPFASSSCRLWYAIDDVDYRGAENLRPYRDLEGDEWGRDNLDDNAIITRNAWAYSGSDPDFEEGLYYQNQFVGLPSGSYGGGSIPSEDAAMGIPASAAYVDGIFRVEMAELQMWTGVTMDTGIESNRRAFVDENGEPVDPTEGAVDPETQQFDPRGPGERLLGKKPEILLHGSDNWKEGYNTGTLGISITTTVDEAGKVTETITKIPSGQFTPTAKISQYKPEPALEETESA